METLASMHESLGSIPDTIKALHFNNHLLKTIPEWLFVLPSYAPFACLSSVPDELLLIFVDTLKARSVSPCLSSQAKFPSLSCSPSALGHNSAPVWHLS